MPGEIPPSFSGFKFNTIGKNSLLSRLSEQAPQTQEISMAQQQDDEQEIQDDDDLYAERDLDSNATEPAGRQPNLLARISDPNATFSTAPSTSGQVAGIVSDPTPSYQTRRTSDMNKQPATGANSSTIHSETSHTPFSESREAVHMLHTRSGQGTSIGIEDTNAPGHIPLFAVPAIPLTLSKSSSLPTPPPSGSTVSHQNYHSTFFAEAPFTPGRTSNSLFSQFPYAPLTELLNEERAAWSEVWETKQSQAAGTSNSISVVPPVRAQASPPSHLEPTQREKAPSSSSPERGSVDHAPSTISSEANARVVASRSVVPVQPSTPMDEASTSSKFSTEQLVRKGKNEVDPTAPSSTAVSTNSCASDEVPRDDTTSFSVPLKPTTSLPAESQNLSSQAVSSRAPGQERSTIVDERCQIPKIDNVDAVLGQQSSTRSSAAEFKPPRENELKALLKARRTSQGVESKDSLEQNERRSPRDTNSVPPTPVSPSRPALSMNQGLGNRNDFLGQTGSAKVLPPLLAVRSGQPPSVTEDGSSPRPIHAPPSSLLPHNNHTSGSASSYSENANPVKRKPSTSPLPQRDKDVSEVSKRQKRNDSRVLKEEADANTNLLSQPIIKDESSSLLPPTPISAGSSRSFTANTSAANRKRALSSAVKAEDDGDSNSVAVASSHPLKRPKVSRDGPGPRVKMEEEEPKIEELGIVNLPIAPHGLPNVPLPTQMKVECSEDSSEAAPQDLVPRLSDLQSQIAASQGDPVAQLGSRIAVPWGRDSSFKPQQNVGNDSIARISVSEANTGLSKPNDERDVVARTSGSQLRTGHSEQQSGISAPHSQANTFHNRSSPDEEPAARQPLIASWNARELPARITVPEPSQSNVSQPGSAEAHARSPLTNPNKVSSREATQFDRHAPTNIPSPRSDRGVSGREVLQRGRSRERQPRVVDHWSPPRPQSPLRTLSGLVANSYRPFRSPSPSRFPRRPSDDYRRQYDGERTPPRLSWNGRRRSSSRRRSMSPFRRSRSPPPRRAQAQPIYSHYSPSPPRRAIYSPSPPPRRASPRQGPSLNVPLPPKRQRADFSHSGTSFQPRDNHDGDARPSFRNGIAPPTGRYYRSTEDSRVSSEVRRLSSIRQQPPPNRVGGDMLGGRNAGPDTREPARSQDGGNAPLAEHQVNPFPSLPSVSVSDGRVNSSGSTIQKYHAHDAHRDTRLPSDRIDGIHYPAQGRQEDRSAQLGRSWKVRQTEVFDPVSNDDGSSSRGRQHGPRVGNPVAHLPLLVGTTTSQADPSLVVAETLPIKPQTHVNRPDLADSHLNNLENERGSLQGGNRYRYVDPIDHTSVGSMNEDDEHGERTHDDGKAYGKQLEETNHGRAELFNFPGLKVQNMQGPRQPSPPHSAPISAHAPVQARLLPTALSRQGQGSSQSPQVVQAPPSTLEQNLAQTTKTTDRLRVTSNTRDLVNRIGVVEPTPTTPVRKRREPARSNAVDASTSQLPSLVSRLGVSSVKETAQLADRFAAAPVTSLPTLPLISRLRDAPEASGPAHPLPPKPVLHRPPGGGKGRAGLPPSPPPFDKPTLLGRMRSPGRGTDLPHEQPHVGRSSTGRGRGRGSGVTQNTTRAGRDSHPSSKPSLEDRFS